MIDIRLVKLTLFGPSDRREISFSTGLNVIIGPYGSGKTSLLELIKYALGGQARLSDAVRQGVTTVVLEAALRGPTLAFERDIGGMKVQVSQGGDQVAVLHSSRNTKDAVLASSFILEQLGLPVIRVRRGKSAHLSATETLSFWDIYRYVYVSQNDMGHSIAGHGDSNLDRKRVRAFELMFGLLDSVIAELETREASAKERLVIEEKRLADITTFLSDAGVPTRARILAVMTEVRKARHDGQSRLTALRDRSRAATTDFEPEQNAIGELYSRRADLDLARQRIRTEIEGRRRLIAQLTLEHQSLERGRAAEAILAPIDFRQCPRCLQTVHPDRTGQEMECYLCLQTISREETNSLIQVDEGQRIASVIREIEDLIIDDEQAVVLLDREVDKANNRLRAAEATLRARTDHYVAPLFEDVAGLSALVAEADTEERRLNDLLAQWEERGRIQKVYDSVALDIASIARDLVEERTRLEVYRHYVQELSDTFDEIVRELELAWYTSANVDLHSYLPVVGDGDFESLSGGQRTIVSVAYHLALMTVGLVNQPAVKVPSLLIFDTPSKYLGNNDRAQVVRDYRRIAAIVDAYDSPIQILVADNDPPPPGVRPSNRIVLSYEAPLVPGWSHPGPDSVESIHEPYDDE